MALPNQFIGVGLFLQSVSVINANTTLRVSFSNDPIVSDPTNTLSATNPTNWSVVGAGFIGISSITVVGGNPQTVDLRLTSAIPAGSWTITVSNVQMANGTTLSAPTSLAFVVTALSGTVTINPGSANPSCESIIRQHLNPTLQGNGWNSLISGIAVGDCQNYENVELAFNQMFVVSAVGSYLDRLTLNDGITRPNIGLSDVNYRKLATKISNSKVTNQSILDVLEVFYGSDATRAFATTALSQPYALTTGDDLNITLDGVTKVTVVFQTSDFENAGVAKAVEVAAAITRAFIINGLKAYAISFVDPSDGTTKVKIYSGALGLRGSVQIRGSGGGKAQNALQFQTALLSVYPGSMVGQTWTITKNTATNTLRWQTTASGIDLTKVIVGDYVNIFGANFATVNKGCFELTNVNVTYPSGVLTQYFEVIDVLGTTGTPTQAANTDLQFFRPTVNTTQTTNGRTVVVTATTPGELDVTIPATTAIVNRTLKTGSYLHANAGFSIDRIMKANNVATAYYTGGPAIVAGDTVYIDGANTTPFPYFIDTGVTNAYPATSTTDAARVDIASDLATYTGDANKTNFDTILAANGDALAVGGVTVGPTAILNVVGRYHVASSATFLDATLADGATRYTYQWLTPGAGNGFEYAKAANITTGTAYGNVLIAGGNSTTLANWSVPQCPTAASVKIYSPTANTTVAGSTNITIGSGASLTTLNNGNILFYGGCDTQPSVTGLQNGGSSGRGYVWNALTQNFTSFANPNNATSPNGRSHHTATVLPSGKVLLAGGVSGATTTPNDTNTYAFWQLNDTGATLVDTIAALNMTVSGTSASVMSQVDLGREFTQGASASVAGSAPALAMLLGDWTVEWWGCGATGTYPGSMTLSGTGAGTVLAYGAASETQANNTILQVGVSGSNMFAKFENGAGIDVTTTVAINHAVSNVYNYYAVRKASNFYTFFCNGISIGTWNPGQAPDGGTTSGWLIASNPDASTGYSGVLNSIRLSKIARSDSDILQSYFYGCGSGTPGSNAGGLVHRIGQHQAATEELDTSTGAAGTGVMTVVGDMILPRVYHTAHLLPDGRVMAIGGMAYDPTSFSADLYNSITNNILTGPSQSTNVTEIYDPNTKRWERGPVLLQRRHKHASVYVASRNSIFIIGGYSTQGDDCLTVEMLNLTSMKSTVYNGKLTTTATGAVLVGNTILCVSDLGTVAKLLILDTPTTGSADLNGPHRITATGAGSFSFATRSDQAFASFGQADLLTTTNITTGIRTSNVTTLTFSVAGHGFVVGDKIFVNFLQTPANFGSGLKVVTAIGASTVSYADIASNQGSTGLTGKVYKNYSPVLTASMFKAVGTAVPGPYLFDPKNGLAITSSQSTLTAALNKAQAYSILPVADSTVFVDSTGWLVIGFGFAYQTPPIQYFGRYNAFGLLIDYNYKMPANMPIGATVTFLAQRAPFAPTTPIGGFYLTGAAAGRVAAEAAVMANAAAGINTVVTIAYPGDYGLGNAGYPVSGQTKLSDKVVVWGSDDLDNEIKGLRP